MADQDHLHDHLEDREQGHTHTHSHDQGQGPEHDHIHTHDHEQGHAHTHTHDHEQGHTHDHTHDHEQGHTHDHDHTHSHSHSHGGHHHHVHSDEEKKAVINRLSRAIGHLESVKRMVQRDEDCADVLIQLAAVRNAINNTGKLIMKNHISHCIVEAIEEDDMESVEALNRAIDRFIK